ncbi:MAG: RNA methyltransferase [Erysipelotrichales bacterium]|nr:RNA methyltransferase [Erysipelotrichales bacterium]
MIESVNNEKIKNYSKLNQKKFRDETHLFIVEGEHLVDEAKKNDLLVEVFSLDGSIGIQVSLNVMKKLSSLANVPNVIGIAKMKHDKKIEGNVLILDNIQDPGNLGTIIRSAVAFGIDTIIASNNTVDVYNTKVLRGSEGMFFHLNYIIDDLNNVLSNLKGYEILTTNVKNGEDIANLDINKPYALIVGNEGAGVSQKIASYANKTLYIPMNDVCESLNVAIATSIILYEINKK